MKEKRECKLVQDLLPNYIEKVISEETNQYMEEHSLLQNVINAFQRLTFCVGECYGQGAQARAIRTH